MNSSHGVAGEKGGLAAVLRMPGLWEGRRVHAEPRTQSDSESVQIRGPSWLPAFPLSAPLFLPGFPADAEKTDLGLNRGLNVSVEPAS